MVEINIRLVSQRKDLTLTVRRVRIESQDSSPNALQAICTALKQQRGLAAIPDFETAELLVASQESISELVVKEEHWQAKAVDTNNTRLLKFEEPKDAALLTQLLERCLLIQIEQSNNFWTLESPRTFYELEPFLTDNCIAAYRRYRVSSILCDDVGVGLIVDVSVAFFTTLSVADFFRDDLPAPVQAVRQTRFETLSRRQQGQKATLWYASGRNHSKCYFAEFARGLTCATTGEIRVAGHTHASLKEYYQKRSPNLAISANDAVARVSFTGLDKPQPVAAKQLRLRVMNDSLPGTLKQVDKLLPKSRCDFIENFWTMLGEHPLGLTAASVEPRFWQPPTQKIVHLKRPDLIFGQQQILSAPTYGNIEAEKEYYRQRSAYLRKFGCLIVPPAIVRKIYVRVPTQLGDEIANQLGDDLVDSLSTWTGKTIQVNTGTYDSLEQVFSDLRREAQSGMVVFVFENEDPADYHRIAYELQRWRVKRITCDKLEERFTKLQSAKGTQQGDRYKSKGERDWQSFVDMSALDVLQLLDCIPWGIASNLHYDAQLAIDVGWDYRHFGLSLLICQWQTKKVFQIDPIVKSKSDVKKETINRVILCDEIVAIFRRRERPTPLHKVLILRDGRECGEELEAIEDAREKLIALGIFDEDTQIDVVDVYKDSVKEIRLWARGENDAVYQIGEGKAVLIDKRTIVIATTGAPTLHQGTAEPILLVGRNEGIDMISVAEDFYASTHLNWSSPSVAQRLTIGLKRLDDQLINRASQEIRRYS